MPHQALRDGHLQVEVPGGLAAQEQMSEWKLNSGLSWYLEALPMSGLVATSPVPPDD